MTAILQKEMVSSRELAEKHHKEWMEIAEHFVESQREFNTLLETMLQGMKRNSMFKDSSPPHKKMKRDE